MKRNINIKVDKCENTGHYTASSTDIDVVVKDECPVEVINVFKKEARSKLLLESFVKERVILHEFVV